MVGGRLASIVASANHGWLREYRRCFIASETPHVVSVEFDSTHAQLVCVTNIGMCSLARNMLASVRSYRSLRRQRVEVLRTAQPDPGNPEGLFEPGVSLWPRTPFHPETLRSFRLRMSV